MHGREPLQLVLTGDSMITRHAFISDDAQTQALVARIQAADLAFTNLEVLPNDFKGYPSLECGGTHMAASSWVIDDLLAAGIDFVACATNHALDYSIEGLLATMEVLERKGLPFAGVGHTLAEARMPCYVECAKATVALVSCVSTFAKGQVAADQRSDMSGRPGINPLRYKTVYELPSDQLAFLRDLAEGLGLEERRREMIDSGFGFPPDDPDVLPFLGNDFRAGDRQAIRMKPNEKDVDAIVQWIHESRARADIVLVSMHAHERGASREDPAEFIPAFAHRAIDEGADIVVGHGPHLLRGMEMYHGKPIFYSLGNFIAQNDLVYKLPADAYDRFRTDPTKTPSEVFKTRTDSERKGFPADERYWQTVVPICAFNGEGSVQIELTPVTLGFGQPVHRRGRPRLAEGDESTRILERFAQLSAAYGTRMVIDDGRAIIQE